MPDAADAFLQTYMQSQAEQAANKRAVQQFAWQNLWNNAKLQQERELDQQRIDQQGLYQRGLLQNDVARTKAATAKDMWTALSQGGTPAETMQQAAPLASAQVQPTGGENGPALALPSQQQTVLPAGTPVAGAVDFGNGQLVRRKTPAELQAEQAAQQDATFAQIDKLYPDPKQAALVKQIVGLKLQGLNPNAADLQALGLIPTPKTVREGDEPLTQDEIDRHNQTVQQFAAANGQPVAQQLLLKPGDTRNARANAEKSMTTLQGAVNTQATRAATAAQRASDLAIRQQLLELSKDRSEQQQAKTANAIYQPAMDSAERFNVMTDAYEKAVKGDQQAMLNLLANHIGMTMGLQKGSRITQAIYQEAEKSRPWLQGIAAHFDKNGYLSGVALSPEQMQQMVGLGQGRFSEDTTKAKSQAQFAHLDTSGPKRTPNAATMRFYIHQAGGDVGRAKALAAADGWTIE